MDIEIRLAHVEEQEEIIKLQSRSLRVLSSKDYAPNQIESLVKGQAAVRFKSEVVFVAIFQKKIVGFASLLVDRSQIGAVFINPEFARQGIGSRLVRVVENAAIEKGYKSMYVLSSLTAISFYQKQGYQLSSDLGFFSEGMVWIPCKRLKKRLIELTAAQKARRRIWVLAIALIVIISLAIALL